MSKIDGEISIQRLLGPLMSSVEEMAEIEGTTSYEVILSAVESAVLKQQVREGIESPRSEVITDLKKWERDRISNFRARLRKKAA